MIHFRKPKGKPMDRRHKRTDAARSKVRSAVEHVFAVQKSRMGLFVRTIRIERAKVKIGMGTWPKTSNVSSGTRGEVRPRKAEMATKGAREPKNQTEIRQSANTIAPTSPPQTSHAKTVRFFEVSSRSNCAYRPTP